ncbi:LapA family protein [Allopusillimonas ginsengisoli]|uniref:LapA family protein n=1 Tax=Allopusillimonas ginsengisoli TaxID=453575 RepID=UPI0010C201C6|nr:LapA family protein [Allopusillimonas ginsengisoli]
MRYLVWLLRLVVFVLVLMFALKNTGPVDVTFFAGYTITAVPLIVVMLVVFVLGIVLGLLIAMPSVMRKRRETARLRRDVARLEAQLSRPLPATDAVVPETVVPMAPL